MGAGLIYTTEYIRKTEREKALKGAEKTRAMLAEKQRLVDAGKARWIKEPILNGYKLHFEMIK